MPTLPTELQTGDQIERIQSPQMEILVPILAGLAQYI